MNNLKFGIIGTNFISDRFFEAVSQSGCAEVTAVYSRKLDTGEGFAEKHGIPKVYTDLSEMLGDGAVGAVYIASPTFCHFEQAMAALEAGKHVLCEKMICLTAEELRTLRAVARERGLALLEAMRPDFDPAYKVISEAIGSLGKIRRATLEFCQYSRRYDKFLGGTVLNAFNPKLKNSALADIGIYPLHTAVALFGAPSSVLASAVFLENGFEGAGSITLDYGDKLVGIVYSKITESVNPSVIEGERGSLTIDKISSPSSVRLLIRGECPCELPLSPIENNMVYEVKAFVEITEGRASSDGYLDVSEKTLAIVEEAYRRTGASYKMI